MNKLDIKDSFKALQQRICNGLEKLDGKANFDSDLWNRFEGGGGITNTIKEGNLIEKGGVAFSEVFGEITPLMKNQLNYSEGEIFYATGVSIVLHPKNPFVPIIHMNVRYFELDEKNYWFGGGIDLTPHYINESQAKVFHHDLKNCCDLFDKDFYAKFKTQADDYFFIPHRNETRGIGGIFFDHLNEDSCKLSKSKLHEFVLSVGNLFVETYSKQANFGRNLAYNENNLAWQSLRRGRYVEFNLVNDRGTKFGLFSGGRTESILMSLPPIAKWEYNLKLIENSEEQKTLNLLQKGLNWIDF